MTLSPRLCFGVAVALPPAAVATALVTQHVYGMQPCPWCILQRVIFLAMALTALPGLVASGALIRKLSAAAVLLLAGCGMAAALWQHFVAAASASCNLTVADRIVGGLGLDALWPAVFEPQASCADAAVKLLGVPYEFYSLSLFVVVAMAAVLALRRAR